MGLKNSKMTKIVEIYEKLRNKVIQVIHIKNVKKGGKTLDF